MELGCEATAESLVVLPLGAGASAGAGALEPQPAANMAIKPPLASMRSMDRPFEIIFTIEKHGRFRREVARHADFASGYGPLMAASALVACLRTLGSRSRVQCSSAGIASRAAGPIFARQSKAITFRSEFGAPSFKMSG
jgi:hypothetical protein